ncbi:hypothetical protein LAV_00184 [Sphingobium phage Lacusarx]|uniref:Uncharacterized protein n=1 Tax=Sphingobium phage Lacusarx TaxID=1980139 RepID=A0A1W6DXE5_9CAUD|nr:hypothetical protein FDH44_gp119 [Sphingobium phage Lacusarx]ARK07559.1 hypothetical protein LAV_00184 [Sphingobium phage Lacusarx]
MNCATCDEPTTVTANGNCPPCYNAQQEAWQKRMAIRLCPDLFDKDKLIRLLLSQHWQHECDIIVNYMPPYPRPDTQPRCVVRYCYDDGTEHFLRHSAGPMQGYFWDIYGDDFHSPELALLSISNAPAPPRVHAVIPTHGR